ncbi:MAG: ferrous iron transport protein B [Planctomycetes bacterium]|nr:ferrous iron transport protein B [Planctomycetota bacterium]MBI3834677.1 ferrous iron transport protein B [Planctomycetota bacterium]
MPAVIPLTVAPRTRTVAVVGNPNTGKSTLFNALTGFRQRVGNYPGVTVERHAGFLRDSTTSVPIEIVDLPGTYSLSVHAEDEAIVLDALLGRSDRDSDLIVSVVDAANLSRNLFLTTQILELGTPVIVALNMMDLADRAGIRVDCEALSRELGVPVIPIVANKGTGIAELRQAIVAGLDSDCTHHCPSFPECVCAELDGLCSSLKSAPGDGFIPSRVEAMQTLLAPGGFHESRLVKRCGRGLAEELAERRHRITTAGESVVEVEAQVRYAWIQRVVDRVVIHERPETRPRTEIADRILTHPIVGLTVFVAVMAVIFQSVYALGGPLRDFVDGGFTAIGQQVASWIPAGAIRSLIVDGVIAGVGAVLTFLPQILILFFFIAILEDCGYMARAAFLLDRWMGTIGLNGKSFIPLLSSFACAVPGIMATRTIEDRRDRFVTILIAPLMSCSARLPVYVLLIGAFVPATAILGGLLSLQAATLLAMYGLGAIVAIPVAIILKRTVLKGPVQSFLLELPTFKWPSYHTVFFRVFEQGKAFTVSAGTMIFAVAIVIWALGYYPHPASIAAQHDALRQAAIASAVACDELSQRLAAIDHNEASEYLNTSLLGRMGRWIEPAVKPLGWDWRIGTAAIASFPAREVVVATMGTIYGLGSDKQAASQGLREKMKSATWPDGKPVFNAAVAFSLMVFFALCCQCGATLATIKRETRSWRWPVFTFVYMTSLAYVGALITYQVAIRFI